MMRIAYVCADPGIPVFGCKGASVHVQGVIRAFLAAGHQVTLFAVRGDGVRPDDLADLTVRPLPRPASVSALHREREMLSANRSVAALIDSAGPFDMVYERYALWSFGAMEYARGRGIPGVLEVNAPLVEEQAWHRVLHDRAGAEKSTAQAFAAASALIAVSAEVAGYLERVTGDRARTHVVPNGIDRMRFDPESVRPPGVHPFTVGFLGTLKPWHGIGHLMSGFDVLRRQVPDARLLVVGDGPESETLREWADAEGLRGSVELTGAVGPQDVPELLSRMDAAVAPYPPITGFYFSPLKVVEYMASGRALVASRIGQIEQLVEDERTGLLVSPGDPVALAGALRRLHDDVMLRQRLGRAAREHALRYHTWDSVVARILEIGRRASTVRRHALSAVSPVMSWEGALQ